jgi:hypothetical protein
MQPSHVMKGRFRSSRDASTNEGTLPLIMGRFHSPRRYQGRTLAVPKAAMFPNQIGDVKFDRFWNFLCRQIYVLTQTYATDTQRAIAIPQYAMNGAAHACIAIGGVCASLLTMYLLVAMTAGALAEPWHSPQPAPLGAHGQCNFAAGAQSMPNEWPTWRSAFTFTLTLTFTFTRVADVAIRTALTLPLGPLTPIRCFHTCRLVFSHCPFGPLAGMAGMAMVYWVALLFFGSSAIFTLRSFASLCNVLSPHGFGGTPIDVSHIGALRVGH